jgi:DedD protein
MSNGLQQRIIGALVLGALGLIILPIIFDFADPLKMDRTSKLPPAPEIKSIDVAKAQRPDNSSKLGETDSLFNVAKSKVSDDSSETFYGLDENGLLRAWVLQAGSFEEKIKATDLMQKLRDSGFKAFVKAAEIDAKTFYRVYVGPKADKRRAIAEKANLDSNFSTDAIVLQYVP